MKGNDNHGPGAFRVIERTDRPEEEHEDPGRRGARIAAAMSRALPSILTLAVLFAGVVLVTREPRRAEPSAPAFGQALPSPEPTHEIAELQPLPVAKARSPETKVTGRKHSSRTPTRRITFRVGGSRQSTARPTRPAPAPAPAPAAKPDRQRRQKAASKKERPPEPKATLMFRRLYKERRGDHFHSTAPGAIAAKQDAGYELVEVIGYLFKEQVPGTRLLAIDEGVMGWIYNKDQGERTIPLYRLKGPDYHDFEVIFTSSEGAKDTWIGNGWRLERIEGYLVAP